jgi:hypothetical protein
MPVNPAEASRPVEAREAIPPAPAPPPPFPWWLLTLIAGGIAITGAAAYLLARRG